MLYYTAPTDEVFDDLKSNAIKLWKEIGDHPAYIREKTQIVEEVKNIRDNFMYIFAMFDMGNQHKILHAVQPETAQEIIKRLQ